MALAVTPDLTDTALPLQPLASTCPRGRYIEPHQHGWGQVLYAMSGLMWVEMPAEALVAPPQRVVSLPRWKAMFRSSKLAAWIFSPAPPAVALAGLLGMRLGEQAWPLGKHLLAGWFH